MRQTLKILMVEPFPVVRQTLEEQMAALDFELVEAGSVEHAMQLVDPSYDLVLFHLSQGDEPHEIIALRALKEVAQQVPLVFWSNDARDELLVRQIGLGEYMHVPFAPQFITQALCERVERPGMQFRASKRVDCDLLANVRVFQGEPLGALHVLDVSASGLLLAGAPEVPVATRLEIAVHENGQDYLLVGDVVSARLDESGRHLYGVSFDDDGPVYALLSLLET